MPTKTMAWGEGETLVLRFTATNNRNYYSSINRVYNCIIYTAYVPVRLFYSDTENVDGKMYVIHV